MAKRKRLEAPSAEALSALEQSLSPGRSPRNPGVSAPPIAQVAAEAAQAAQVASPEDRAAQAKIAAEAERLRAAEAQGLLITEVPLSQIKVDFMTRDRMDLDPGAMAELVQSIRKSGMRLPIEICMNGDTYGLISGFRRLTAVAQIAEDDGDPAPLIRALIRPAADRAEGLVAMVEENEVRSDLTPYERGRIAVIATREGAFDSLESAVNALYGAASKAKRSKIRSFARVYEELGEVLSFGPQLKERDGLTLASALKDGHGAVLRTALDGSGARSADEEMRVMMGALKGPQAPKPAATEHIKGISLGHKANGTAHQISLKGEGLDATLMGEIMELIKSHLKERL